MKGTDLMTTELQQAPTGDGPVLVRNIAPRARELRLNRPDQANALSEELIAALTREVSAAYSDEIGLLVLSGEGKHFCAGLYRDPDSDPVAADHITTAVRIESLLQLLWSAPFVTVAVIDGAAIGAGAEIAVACDYRVAGETARFAFPGFRLMGVSLGTRRFVETVGADKAFDIVLNNRRLDRDGARAIGLATHALDQEATEALVSELAESVAQIERNSIAHLRDALRSGNGGADLSRVAASLGTAFRAAQEPQNRD